MSVTFIGRRPNNNTNWLIQIEAYNDEENAAIVVL